MSTSAGAVAGELRKALTARSLWGTLLASGLATISISVFVGLTGSLQPDDTVLGGSLTGAVLALLLVSMFGALVVTSEHGSGTIAVSVTAVPRRRTLIAAKAAVASLGATIVGLASSALAVAVGSALITGDHRPGDPFPALVGVTLALAAAAVLGVAIGTLVRHSGGAVAAVAGVVLLPQILGPLFGDLQPWVMGLSPATALQKMTQSSDAASGVAGSLGPWPSLAAVAAGAVALLLLATRSFDRRDI